jgi:hypothetical protein
LNWRDIITGILRNLETYEQAKASFPAKADELEKKVSVEFEKKQQDGLQAESMFISYKPNKINNDVLYKEFEVCL